VGGRHRDRRDARRRARSRVACRPGGWVGQLSRVEGCADVWHTARSQVATCRAFLGSRRQSGFCSGAFHTDISLILVSIGITAVLAVRIAGNRAVRSIHS
jgi:hypothetical protein